MVAGFSRESAEISQVRLIRGLSRSDVFLGIIDSLSAGFRLLARRLDLLVLPLLLDLWLWFMPPLSIALLLEQLASFYLNAANAEVLPAELMQINNQVSEGILMLSEMSNLWTSLANTWMMRLPSMIAILGVLPGSSPIQIDSLPAVVSLVFILSLAGVFIGTIFLELVAGALPIGNGEKSQSWRHFAHNVFRHFGRIVLFVLLVGLGLLLAYMPLAWGMYIASTFVPALVMLFFMLMLLLPFAVFLFLYFSVPAIVMDDLTVLAAMAQSVRLVRANVWSALGFVLLTSWFISLGFAQILTPIAKYGPIGTVTAILINNFLGTGLAIALFVFYRTHVIRMAEEAKFPG